MCCVNGRELVKRKGSPAHAGIDLPARRVSDYDTSTMGSPAHAGIDLYIRRYAAHAGQPLVPPPTRG